MNSNYNSRLSHNGEEELNWLAFRYLACEMTDSETKAFEARLAEEPAAQEALVRSVELSHALAAVLEPDTVADSAVQPACREVRTGKQRGWSGGFLRRVVTSVVTAVVMAGVFFLSHTFLSTFITTETNTFSTHEGDDPSEGVLIRGRQADLAKTASTRDLQRRHLAQQTPGKGPGLLQRGAGDETVEGIVNLWSQLYATLQPEDDSEPASLSLPEDASTGISSETRNLPDSDNRIEDGEFDWVVTALHTAPPKRQPSLMDRIRKEP